jgi:hypothetical protein
MHVIFLQSSSHDGEMKMVQASWQMIENIPAAGTQDSQTAFICWGENLRIDNGQIQAKRKERRSILFASLPALNHSPDIDGN